MWSQATIIEIALIIHLVKPYSLLLQFKLIELTVGNTRHRFLNLCSRDLSEWYRVRVRLNS